MCLICKEYDIRVRVRAHLLQNLAHRILYQLAADLRLTIFSLLCLKRGASE